MSRLKKMSKQLNKITKTQLNYKLQTGLEKDFNIDDVIDLLLAYKLINKTNDNEIYTSKYDLDDIARQTIELLKLPLFNK